VKATAAALARRAREEGAARPELPPMPEKAVLPGLLDFLRTEPEDDDEEDDDPFCAEDLLQRDIPNGIIVNDAAPCPLPRLRGRYRYHVVLRGQERSVLHRLARSLQEITPPKGVHVVIDIDPLTLA
ncbi:MAG TPA: hypothetical protein VHV83_04165, partial [Armatimonadota bacterium]|nr:hypothetical protein [Armatimonadota bacterium]